MTIHSSKGRVCSPEQAAGRNQLTRDRSSSLPFRLEEWRRLCAPWTTVLDIVSSLDAHDEAGLLDPLRRRPSPLFPGAIQREWTYVWTETWAIRRGAIFHPTIGQCLCRGVQFKVRGIQASKFRVNEVF
ncbi:hypothetical protein CONPUDRAFT_79283 [Coniophora puteana RWD-64-598 SS2]|uniref:Uncharacterized protein n=1 Tax=Coniophora puteana (strain RWD-64-598) TaxID=741705 RepID=A0A5M3N6Q0_CONPW|nr:uncharacterized protein CONPUDRAFT_79283 [Coniophora puteana RWD-64-598 SS2]EIW87119.1 hypothetical protein CONPUDRAFT_79283 [Coniophora puteana RWD-64-598 SS2]